MLQLGKSFTLFLWLNNQSCIWAGFYFALNFGVCNFSLLIGHLFLAYQCFFSMHVMKDVVEQTLHWISRQSFSLLCWQLPAAASLQFDCIFCLPVYQAPYIIAILPTCIEVRSIEPRILIQSSEILKPKLICCGRLDYLSQCWCFYLAAAATAAFIMISVDLLIFCWLMLYQ